MPEITPDSGEALLAAQPEQRPEAEVVTEGAAQAAAVQSLEAEHAVAENPERRCADIKIWVEAECDYFGIEPKNDPVADQLTEILFAHEQTELNRGRADYDVTTEQRRRLDRVVEQGFVEQEHADLDETHMDEADLDESIADTDEADAVQEGLEAEVEEEIAENLEEDQLAYDALLASEEYRNASNVDKIAMMSGHSAVPDSEKAKWQSFGRIMAIADRVPEDAPLIRQRLNQLDMSQGVPDPVQFIQTAIFSSPDYNSGVSQATQDAIAAEFGITPTRPAQPRNATEMQTTLKNGRGTEKITEMQKVEEPPGSGIYVEKEVVIGEEPIPFTEQERLVLATNPRITIFPDPPGGTRHRLEAAVKGTDPVSDYVDIPNEGAFPAADINNRMNEAMMNAVFRNGGMTGALEHFHGRGDSSLGASADTDFDSLGQDDMTQAIMQTFIGENTTLGGRFLRGEELGSMGGGLRHLTPGGDFGAFNRMDPTVANQLMTAMFGSGRADIIANLNRATPFINTGGAETPSFEALYTNLYPEDATNGFARLRGIVGDQGMAMLDLDVGESA